MPLLRSLCEAACEAGIPLFDLPLPLCPMNPRFERDRLREFVATVMKPKMQYFGHIGVHTEAFIYGCRRLHVYLCILFNLFLMHGYVPDAFCQSTIIPLVKCKSGDLSDVNNYRAIALSNSITKF